jgi:hypothetical protein
VPASREPAGGPPDVLPPGAAQWVGTSAPTALPQLADGLPAPPPSAARPPHVTVTIDRIDVRAEPPRVAAARQPRSRAPGPTALERYLADRVAGRRG